MPFPPPPTPPPPPPPSQGAVRGGPRQQFQPPPQQPRNQFPPPPPPPHSNHGYGTQQAQSVPGRPLPPPQRGLPPGPPQTPQRSFPSRPPPPPGPPSAMRPPVPQHSYNSYPTRPPPPPSPSMANGSQHYGIPQTPSSRYPPPPTPSRPPPPSASMHPQTHGSYPPNLQPQPPHNPQSRYPSEQQQQQQQQPSTNRYHPSGPPPRQFLFTRSHEGDETNTEAPLPVHYPKGSLASDDFLRNEPVPAADSRFVSLDDGSATLDFIRPTMHRLPNDRHVLRHATGVSDDSNHTHDYMGVICTPMALPSADHPPPPPGRLPDAGYLGRVPVDFTTNREAPPRTPCNAYVNPFGSLSKCNFCHRSSRRQSQTQHGDKVGTVEYPVKGPYVTREKGPVKPHWIFCVDLTCPKVLDYVDLVLDQIWPAFYNEIVVPHIETTQDQHGRKVIKPSVAMVFVCSTGVYIPQKGDGETGSLAQDGFLVMPDVAYDEAFSPQPLEEWSWSLPDEYENMLDLWKSRIRPVLLPQLIDSKVTNYVRNPNSSSQADRQGGHSMSAGGAALQFLVDALEDTGGRAVYWTWRRPNFGLGALVDREALAGGNQRNKTNHGMSLYMPLQDCATSHIVQKDPNLKAASEFYGKLGERCVAAKIALDIIVHTNPDAPQSFLDLATLGRLCEASSGRLTWIGKPSYESAAVWKQAMCEEVMRPLYWSGWDAVFKVRCSQGLQVKATVSSSGMMQQSSSLSGQEDEVEFAVVTPETCVAVTLQHRIGGIPAPAENKFAYVQTALLYTNPWTGDRRVRVSTVAIPVTTKPEQILPAMDFCALAALQLKLNLPHTNYSSASRFTLDTSISYRLDPSTPDQTGDSILTDARHDMFTAMRQVLVAHRKLSVKNGSNALAIPESLKHWPLFVMSTSKSPLLRPSRHGRQRGPQLTDSPRGDERAFYLYHARRVSPSAAMLLVNPLLLDLNAATFEWQKTDSSSTDDMMRLTNSTVVDLPPPLPASVSNLKADGIYLMDTCFALYVLIQQDSYYQNGLSDELQSKIHNASQQLRLWSQVGRAPKCLRPMASLPVIEVYQKTDQVRYQALLRWMALDETTHDKDFGTFCNGVQQKIKKYM